jgi:hypothetical protein
MSFYPDRAWEVCAKLVRVGLPGAIGGLLVLTSVAWSPPDGILEGRELVLKDANGVLIARIARGEKGATEMVLFDGKGRRACEFKVEEDGERLAIVYSIDNESSGCILKTYEYGHSGLLLSTDHGRGSRASLRAGAAESGVVLDLEQGWTRMEFKVLQDESRLKLKGGGVSGLDLGWNGPSGMQMTMRNKNGKEIAYLGSEPVAGGRIRLGDKDGAVALELPGE